MATQLEPSTCPSVVTGPPLVGPVRLRPAPWTPARRRRRPHRPGSAAPRHDQHPARRPDPSRPRLRPRLTPRGRLAATLLVLAMLTTAAVAHRAPRAASAPSPTRQVVVQPGDTLWSIALSEAPDADPRLTVARIISVNRLAHGAPVAPLRPGQVLTVSR